jgi:tetrapyrrole methylase family protein/MazG family protein
MDEYPYLEREPDSEGEWFYALITLARYLRTPGGCPWDREQSSADFAKFAAGESDEMLEAFSENDDSHIAEEVGDTLFCLLASVAAAEEEGRFTLDEVLRGVHAKMIRRHDHVFGTVKATTPEEAVQAWEKAKAAEAQAKKGR